MAPRTASQPRLAASGELPDYWSCSEGCSPSLDSAPLSAGPPGCPCPARRASGRSRQPCRADSAWSRSWRPLVGVPMGPTPPARRPRCCLTMDEEARSADACSHGNPAASRVHTLAPTRLPTPGVALPGWDTFAVVIGGAAGSAARPAVRLGLDQDRRHLGFAGFPQPGRCDAEPVRDGAARRDSARHPGPGSVATRCRAARPCLRARRHVVVAQPTGDRATAAPNRSRASSPPSAPTRSRRSFSQRRACSCSPASTTGSTL